MANDWENIFRNWGSSPSATEQTRCNNALGIIRTAISGSSDLSNRDIITFAQGSYRNHTNVRADSDVDVMVIGEASFAEVHRALRPSQIRLAREVNPTVYSRREFEEKLAADHYFVCSVAREPKVFVLGDDREFARLAAKQLVG